MHSWLEAMRRSERLQMGSCEVEGHAAIGALGVKLTSVHPCLTHY